jgi:hypothetical protein
VSKVTVISGTDPTNPRTAGHIVVRLEQIHRDTEAMAAEARRLAMFASSLRQVLADQGKSDRTAVIVCERLAGRCRKAADLLDAASEQTGRAAAEIRDSGARLSARFVWRPIRLED